MGGFKRLCLAIYSLAGFAALAALGLTVVGPWTKRASQLFSYAWYFYTVLVLAGILAFGLLISLLRALFSRRDRAIVVCEIDGDKVSVTRDAIASQASHIVANDGICIAEDVFVTVGRHGVVDVDVKVSPRSSVDIRKKGPSMHDKLVRELEALCGDSLGSVSIEFLEAQQPSSVAADIEDDISVSEPRKGSEITYIPRPSSSDASSSENESASETDVSNHTEGDE